MKNPEKKENLINEPLELYFKSPAFVKSFKKINISTLEEQEEANLIFSINLLPEQRLEYMNFLNKSFLPQYPENIPKQLKKKIQVTLP